MKTIRFRVPIECNNCKFKGFQYFEWNGQSFTPNGYDKCECEKLEIIGEPQQFIGLKDKNGKECYEGDIILIKDYYTDVVLDDGSGPSYEENQLLEVVFTNGCFGFNTEHSELFDKRFYSFDEYKKDISDEDVEVIGNIFENPELLN